MATVATTFSHPVKPASSAGRATPIHPVTSGSGGSVPLRRFTVAEYQRMIQDGYFADDEAYELLDGLIIHKMARDPIHDASLANARRVLSMVLPTAGWHLRLHSAVIATDSQPEPDLAVVRGSEFDYLSRHPSSSDAPLLIEVANTSLENDRSWKGAVYAGAGYPLYWIINLIDFRIEAYSDPSGSDPAPAYRRREDFGVADAVPFVVDSTIAQRIAMADLLPPVQSKP
jgi:Uma2 family endonuclease